MSNPKIPSRERVEFAIGLIQDAIQDCDVSGAEAESHAAKHYFADRRGGLNSAYFFLTGERIPEPAKAEGE